MNPPWIPTKFQEPAEIEPTIPRSTALIAMLELVEKAVTKDRLY